MPILQKRLWFEGGTAPFTYTFNGEVFISHVREVELNGLAPGIWQLSATDYYGCVSSSTALVESP